MNTNREIPAPPRHPEITTQVLVADDLLDQAFDWLCHRRKDWPPEADVWRFRRDWSAEKARIQEELLAGNYEIGLLTRATLQNQEEVDLWSARDAVVMKALSLVLPQYLPLSEQCTHLKGHWGAKYAVRQVLEHLPEHQFVLKTDIQSYYASIDHQLLLDRLAAHIRDQPGVEPHRTVSAAMCGAWRSVLGTPQGDRLREPVESHYRSILPDRAGRRT